MITGTVSRVLDKCEAGVLVIQAAGNCGPGPYTTASYSPWAVGVASCDTDRTYPGSLVLGNGQRISGIGLSGPTFGNTLLRYKLVLAKVAILANGISRGPRNTFLKGSLNPAAISNTAKILRFMGFVLIANPIDSKIILDYYEKQTRRDSNGVVTAFRGRAAVGEGRFGQSFGLMSGTSMAAPYVAGVAALIKQWNSSWSPSMIASAMATTAFTYENRGFEDYMSFLCSLPNTDPEIIKTAIVEQCAHSFQAPSDLNIPSLTISALNGKQSVRTVKNVADMAETYVCAVVPPNGVAVELNTPWFTIAPEGTQNLE
nr:subtilisin-like protease SBT2.4 [Tanacetum cinerariifolium]